MQDIQQRNADIALRMKFYNEQDVSRLISRDGVPKSTKEMMSMITAGSPAGSVTQELVDCLRNVTFAVHPQQINIWDKANGKLIVTIPR